MSSKSRGSLIIAGFTLIGLGVGFVFLQTSVLWFVASLFLGLGLGLVVASIFGANAD